AGKRCLDVGQSTGGFTDCLLQLGATEVTGVDVGSDQLHDKIRGDERVTVFEKVNARELDAEEVGDEFDFVTADLSFISLTLVLPALVPLLANEGVMLMLVKPQFELQPGQVGKRGVVTDQSFYAVVEKRIRDCCAELGLKVKGWYDSPVTGGDGNREFFVYASR
ncbi:MAG: TlyA family RNA methyltransferase, partial [Ramlibacter sp.]